MRSRAIKAEDNETKSRLQLLAREVMSEISKLGHPHSEELLGAFVSELFLLSGEQRLREKRRQKQAEGIAAAKAKGVHFGPQCRDMPEDFDKLRLAWREKRMTLRAAAAACGVPKSTFRSAVLRAEMAASGKESKQCSA